MKFGAVGVCFTEISSCNQQVESSLVVTCNGHGRNAASKLDQLPLVRGRKFFG